MNVDFIPDEIILKTFSLGYFIFENDTPDVHSFYKISSNIIPGNSDTVITFPLRSNIVVVDPGTPLYIDQGFTMFKTVNYRWLNKSNAFIRGNYTFHISLISGENLTFSDNNYLTVSLTFEFIKH